MGPQRRLPARKALLGVAVLALLAGACSSGSAPSKVVAAPSTTRAPECSSSVAPGEARVDLGDRWYQRHVPPMHGEKPVPLLIDLHGYSSDAIFHAAVTRLGAYGDERGFVTVTPHGAGDPPQWDLAVDGDDVTFVDAIITDAEDTLCIDPDRIFVTGFSMGGFLISTLACSRVAGRVAAFAPVGGVRDVPDCDPPRPVPALVIHGSADEIVFFDGGLSDLTAHALMLPADGPSIEAIVDEWDARDPDADVTLRVVEGGSHAWPRSANDWIWEFFESVG